MTSRRSIAEKVVARARARGTPIDDDLEFMALVELWIAGEMEADGMRDRYNTLLTQQSNPKKEVLARSRIQVLAKGTPDVQTQILSAREMLAHMECHSLAVATHEPADGDGTGSVAKTELGLA